MDFRLYDGALGRFLGVDLLADMFTDHSPYHFGYNNPIAFADPTGLYSNPHPGNSIVIGDNGDIAIYFTNADGDMEAIFFVNRKSGAESQEIKQLGQDPHQYGGGGGGGSNSESGSAGGGGGSGSGSGNSGPREAANGKFSDSEIDTIQDYISNFLTILEKFAEENSKEVSKYGDDVMNAAEKTAENAARMNNIAKRAGVIGNVITAADVVHGLIKDNGTIGQNTQQAIAGAIGGAIGAYEGAIAGAAFGGFVGGFFGGAGAIPGAFVGGIAGAIIGGWMGSEIGESIVKGYYR